MTPNLKMLIIKLKWKIKNNLVIFTKEIRKNRK